MDSILAIDLGSSAVKVLVMGADMGIRFVASVPYISYHPCPGWTQQNPEDWVLALQSGLEAAFAVCRPEEIVAVSFSGHMSGVVLLDRNGGPLCPCITLADLRSEEECRNLRESMGEMVKARTGNPVINAFSAPKLLWIKHHMDVWQQTAVWVSPKDYLRYRLTGRIATEYTDAGNSLLLRNEDRDWDKEMIRQAGLDSSIFPPVLAPYDCCGAVTTEAQRLFGLKEGTPVYAGAADMACAAVGMNLFGCGEAMLDGEGEQADGVGKLRGGAGELLGCEGGLPAGVGEQPGLGEGVITLGTSATFLLAAEQVRPEAAGAVTYHLNVLPGTLYALGSHFNGGLVTNCFSQVFTEREEVDYDFLQQEARKAGEVPPGSGGILTIPFLTGSGSPYFNPYDRGTVLGLYAGCSRSELMRSALEGVAYNMNQTLRLFEKLEGRQLRRIYLGGGGIRIPVWPQIFADVMGREIDTVAAADASAAGAAIIGGYGAGMFPDIRKAASLVRQVQDIIPPDEQAHKQYKELMGQYQKAYEAVAGFYQERRG